MSDARYEAVAEKYRKCLAGKIASPPLPAAVQSSVSH
jgi:hypothetical protein